LVKGPRPYLFGFRANRLRFGFDVGSVPRCRLFGVFGFDVGTRRLHLSVDVIEPRFFLRHIRVGGLVVVVVAVTPSENPLRPRRVRRKVDIRQDVHRKRAVRVRVGAGCEVFEQHLNPRAFGPRPVGRVLRVGDGKEKVSRECLE